MVSVVHSCVFSTLHFLSALSLCKAFLIQSLPLQHKSNLCHTLANHISAIPLQDHSLPFLCGTLLRYSSAYHCLTLQAKPYLSKAKQYLAIAQQYKTTQFHCKSAQHDAITGQSSLFHCISVDTFPPQDNLLLAVAIHSITIRYFAFANLLHTFLCHSSSFRDLTSPLQISSFVSLLHHGFTRLIHRNPSLRFAYAYPCLSPLCQRTAFLYQSTAHLFCTSPLHIRATPLLVYELPCEPAEGSITPLTDTAESAVV